MGKGILSIIGLGSGVGSPEEDKTDSIQDRKVTAAEEAVQAIKDEDPEALADALTAFVRTCKLEGMKGGKSDEDTEE